MKKAPWDQPELHENDPSTLVAYEEFRTYRALNRRYRRKARRQRLLRQFGIPTLAALGGFAVVGIFLSYGPSLGSLLSFGPSPSGAQVGSTGPFRNCAAARAAGAAPIYRGQPGYAPHLDADGDGLACEWSWRNWFW